MLSQATLWHLCRLCVPLPVLFLLCLPCGYTLAHLNEGISAHRALAKIAVFARRDHVVIKRVVAVNVTASVQLSIEPHAGPRVAVVTGVVHKTFEDFEWNREGQ